MSSALLDTLIDWSNETHKTKLYKFLEQLPASNHWITIKKYRKSRSKEANSYYWVGIVRPICEYEGYDPDNKDHLNMIHEKLKRKFNSKPVEFKRTVFAFELGNGFEEIDDITEYLDKKNWQPDLTEDKKIIVPLYVVKNISEVDIYKYGEEVEISYTEHLPVTTTKLDTVEHYEFIERIRDHYALEHNLYLSSPDDKKNFSELG